ncbi:hypothetical protein QYE76_018992 [Lolium multiflorum]|uniref:Uncharacterized protein n=1 Tax=Lolium multiflorum TaxID=4521 RepID=A0AAD8V2P9_LOLMU|nr:hypothetical protein QYE76_018992 [Lolium multiflorum]
MCCLPKPTDEQWLSNTKSREASKAAAGPGPSTSSRKCSGTRPGGCKGVPPDLYLARKEVLIEVAALTSSKAMWDAIRSMFTSTSWINNLRIALANGRKENKTVTVYFTETKSYTEELARAGKTLAEEKLISYILAGLDKNYNPLVSALDARMEEVTLNELFAQMSNFD